MTITYPAGGARVEVAGNGVSTSAAITFPFWLGSDLYVVHTDSTGTDTVWVYGVDYNTTGGSGTTGAITYSAADLASGEKLTILLKEQGDQPVDVSAGAGQAASIEGALDKAVSRLQREMERVDRAPKLKASTRSNTPTFPEPAAGQLVGWNSGGTDLENRAIAASGETFPTTASAYIKRNSGGTAFQALTPAQVADDLRQYFSVATIAALTAKTKASLDDGDTILVHAPLVGGVFRWVAASTATADGGTVFASDEGGTGRWLRQYEGPVWAHYYNAKGDGTTDDSSALALWLAGPGPWAIRQGAGEYITNAPLVIAHEQIIECHGRVVIKAGATFSGTALLKSEDFDTLSGSNNWFYSDGVPSGFGYSGYLRLDGSDKSIKGVQFYGKRLALGKLEIHNCASGGWYSECADAGGQQSYRDMPENDGGHFWIRECGGIAFEYNGPHDGHLASINLRGLDAMTPGTTGLKLGYSAGVYLGACEIDSMHIYGFDTNVDINASLKCLRMISESALGVGAELNAPTGQKIIINQMEMYNNARDTSDYNLKLSGFGIIVKNFKISDQNDGGGVYLSGDRHQISGEVTGVSGTATGLYMDSSDQCSVDVTVTGYNGTGGIGFADVSCNQNQVHVRVNNCTTAWSAGTRGYGNIYELTGNLASGQAVQSGTRPRAGGVEMVRVNFLVNGTAVTSHSNVVSSGGVNLTSTSLQSIIINHGLYAQPYLQHCWADIAGGNAATDWAVDFIRVWSITATQITVQVKLGTASATGGATANLNVTSHV